MHAFSFILQNECVPTVALQGQFLNRSITKVKQDKRKTSRSSQKRLLSNTFYMQLELVLCFIMFTS